MITQQRPSRLPVLALAAIAIGIGAMLAWLSVLRYQGYNAGMLDLGNMAQAIASVLRGEPLVFTYKDGPTSRLALHIELIYFLFAPLYAIWPDPRSLLIAQALLAASAAIPVFRLASRRLGQPWLGVAIAIVYLLYPVAQTAVLFDFHGDTLAMPLLLWAVDAMDRRAWRGYALWLGLALACKFYVAAPVLLFGLVIWRWGGMRRVGLLTAAVGLAYGVFAFFVIRPWFTSVSTSDAHRGLSYVGYYFGQIALLRETIGPRLLNALVVLGPVLLLAARGWPWLLPGLLIILPALLSSGPGSSFDYSYHHYAIAVPFLILAAIHGAASLRSTRMRNNLLVAVVGIVLGANLSLVNTPLSPLRWNDRPGGGRDHTFAGSTARDAVKDQFIADVVPPNAAMAASVYLASHIVNRTTLYLTRYPEDVGGVRVPLVLPYVEYILTDALFDFRVVAGEQVFGGATYEVDGIARLLAAPSVALVASRDGLLLFAHDPAPGTALAQTIAMVPSATLPPQPAELGPVRLLGAQIVPLGNRRYQASFEWQLASDTPPTKRWVAVSRIGGRDDMRIVHLPSYVLLPAEQWQPGQIVRETFELELPDLPAGVYPWTVAWYDTSRPEGHATDTRSLPPGVQPVTVGNIDVP